MRRREAAPAFSGKPSGRRVEARGCEGVQFLGRRGGAQLFAARQSIGYTELGLESRSGAYLASRRAAVHFPVIGWL